MNTTTQQPVKVGRIQVLINGDPAHLTVIDIDKMHVRLFAADDSGLVRSLDWWDQVGGVKWLSE